MNYPASDRSGGVEPALTVGLFTALRDSSSRRFHPASLIYGLGLGIIIGVGAIIAIDPSPRAIWCSVLLFGGLVGELARRLCPKRWSADEYKFVDDSTGAKKPEL